MATRVAINGFGRIGGEVEAEMHLAIDFLALVHVRPVIGERGFGRAVRVRMKDLALPEHFRRRAGGE